MTKFKCGDAVLLLGREFIKDKMWWDRLYDNLNTLDGVIVEVEDAKYDYGEQRYLIEFKSDKGNCPNWYIYESAIGTTERTKELEELYLNYLTKKEEEKQKIKYIWGKCKKCGSPLDMHYGLWCPSCSNPEDLIQEDSTLDILKVLTWCDIRRNGFKKRMWDKLCDRIDFTNDSFHKIYFDRWEEDEDATYIVENFGTKIRMFEFSW